MNLSHHTEIHLIIQLSYLNLFRAIIYQIEIFIYLYHHPMTELGEFDYEYASRI